MVTRLLMYADPPPAYDPEWGTVTTLNEQGDCARCGAYADWRTCWHCGGACELDLYENDPMWYVGKWRYQPCPECYGDGGWSICTRGCYYAEPAEDGAA